MDLSDIAPNIDLSRTQAGLGSAVRGGFGEVYIEKTHASSLVFDQNRLYANQTTHRQGMGVRRVQGAETYYVHNENLEQAALAEMIQALGAGHGQSPTTHKPKIHTGLYESQSIPDLVVRTRLLDEMNQAIRALDSRIVNVTITLSASMQNIAIIMSDGAPLLDARPLVLMNIGVTVEENGRYESGHAAQGGRYNLQTLFDPAVWMERAREALRIALVNLGAQPCPAGEMMLLLGPGWPGVLFHEAVGHGLEGDFNRRRSSAFHDLMGKRVAAKGVRVIDDGTLPLRRGSLHFDDEGGVTACNTLIEDGILVGYLQDRLNAELMGVTSTGNARRESYAHAPMPRMMTTFLDQGHDDPQAMLASMDFGIYAVGFGGGQVDITSGKFVFNCTEAYRVEKGKILHPVKGATLIGDGPTALGKIVGIGSDLGFDPGIGNCGKAGQTVPVGIGQPSVLMHGITIGGTEI